VDERTELFLDVVANIITGRAADIDYVDMRYSNGFTIGWNEGAETPLAEPQEEDPAMLASRGAP
jgi:cell division septal protein FtsQ